MADQKLATFEFEELAVRLMDQDGDPWFVLVDVCRALDIGNSRQAASRLDEDEKSVITNDSQGGPGIAPQLTIISESGLYSLIMSSRKPEAKRFRKWVTSEVIPAIRRTGRYVAPDMAAETESRRPDPLDPVEDTHQRLWLDIVREARLIAGKPAALAIWRQSPLPPLPGPGGRDDDVSDHPASVLAFLQDGVAEEPGQMVQASRLYDAYCRFAHDRGDVVHGIRTFARTALEQGLRRIERSGGRFWQDLRLLEG